MGFLDTLKNLFGGGGQTEEQEAPATDAPAADMGAGSTPADDNAQPQEPAQETEAAPESQTEGGEGEDDRQPTQ